MYHKKLEPADSLIDYALFISLFPHLIAGPIQRPSHLLPQVQRERRFDPQAFFDGCMLVVSGLFRKCVVADQCALVANAAFEGRFGHSFMATAIGAYAFAWQIYGDFSGYSDIARGAAPLLGFRFMVNFRQPYLATSLQDFWRRWHISLSTWLRDYLYIPLGGNRHGTLMIHQRITEEASQALRLRPAAPGQPKTVLFVGNSLLLHSVDLPRLVASGGSRYRVSRYVVESTRWFDWYEMSERQ